MQPVDEPVDTSASLVAESPELLRAVIASAPTALVMIDAEGTIVLANAESERLFGYPPGSLLGRPLDMLVPESVRGLHPAYRSGYFVEPVARPMGAGRNLFARRRDGTEFPVEIGLKPIVTENGVHVLSAIVDITERKRLEARFRATIESAPIAMVMIDRKGTIVLVNRELEVSFGYDRNEILGQPIEILVPPSYRPTHPQLRTGFFAQPQARRMGAGRDLFAVRKDGSEFPVEIGLSPVETDDGLFVLSALVDITERERLAANQAAFAQELEARVVERTAELSRSHEALARSNVELQQFAYIASHDLQAPLRRIAGFVQLLRQKLPQVDPDLEDLVQRVVGSVERMRQLIGDLLAYARVESRERPFEPTDLCEVFDDAIALLAPSIEAAGAEVTRSALPVVQGDRSQLVQLLQNLIGNALKYHGDSPPRVHVDAVAGDREWTLSVRDNGIGIAPQHQEQIFEVFRRLHADQKFPGTGIGLAVCRRVVQRHGGRIWVESQPGHGSVFRFTIEGKEPTRS